MEQLVKTNLGVYQMSFGTNKGAKNDIQFHKDAQLLIIPATWNRSLLFSRR